LNLTPEECPKRHAERHAFLKHQAKSLMALPSDASKRRYFRYEGGLLMDAPASENPAQFVRVAEYLRSFNLSTPQVFEEDLALGFVSLEDFGNMTYTCLLKAGNDPYPLYDLAVDTLIALHQRIIDPPDFIPLYDKKCLLREVETFIDWYIYRYLGEALSTTQRGGYLDLWSEAFEKALKVPHTFVLRDYHVDNLMFLEGRSGIMACGLLDFQDAAWGPIIYDLVSLIEDERLDLEPALVTHCWQRYLKAFPNVDEQALRQAACILGASRHTKNIGVFTRLAVRDGKEHYLKHLPRMWRLLLNCLDHPDLYELKIWFESFNENVFFKNSK